PNRRIRAPRGGSGLRGSQKRRYPRRPALLRRAADQGAFRRSQRARRLGRRAAPLCPEVRHRGADRPRIPALRGAGTQVGDPQRGTLAREAQPGAAGAEAAAGAPPAAAHDRRGAGNLGRVVRCCEALTLIACAACATAGGHHPPVSADDARFVDSLFAAYTGPAVPGASVIVIQDGAVVVRRAYGMADLERGVAAAPETDYRLASVSKQFTAMATMLLVNDGKLRYDQAVSDILPELPPAARAVTVRHLLNHTSGLWDYEDLIPESRTAQLDDQDVLTLLSSKDSVYFPAGTEYRYSNSGYVLLGLIVARVSGLAFPEFLRTRIFAPLEMRASVAHVEGKDTVPHRAFGYSPQGGGFVGSDQSVTSATLGDGGIYTNVDDMTRWDQALYAEGKGLVDAATLTLATTPPSLPAGAQTEYGFGWFVDRYRGVKRWRHTGETSGFRNAIQRYPDRRLTIVILTNRSSGEPGAIAERIAD